MKQEQFLDVIDRDEAERRFRAVLDLRPLSAEEVSLNEAWNRVLAADVAAPIDVPGFDRSNVDGFALRAEATFGASEAQPRQLLLNVEVLGTGRISTTAVSQGTATAIATGGVVPRGADAVVMVEDTEAEQNRLLVRRPATPGANISFAGTDIGRGETVLRRGEFLTSRETGVLAALGLTRVAVVRRPRVAILSTGDEIIKPGEAIHPGQVFDSNATVLADTVRELGGEPVLLGIVPDSWVALDRALRNALSYDVVLLSGGTSKGPGDLSYRAVASLGRPGIVAHGIALKPGKPLCLAAVAVNDSLGSRIVPVVVLPGFPTSAIFTFREFVAPVIRSLAGRVAVPAQALPATMPLRVNSERGRTEYLLVNLVATQSGPEKYAAYPMGKGSGSVTSFSRADGFVIIPRQQEYLEAGERVDVHLIGQGLLPADLVVIGSHCIGLDHLLSLVSERGFRTKFLAVGSTGGLQAAGRAECDLAGIHLLHPETNVYNQPYVGPDLMLLRGYGRLQGIVFRCGDKRFDRRELPELLTQALTDPDCIMINRNRGSGTRILIDRLLAGARPSGYLTEARSHNAVAAAVAQGRADWGMAIKNVADGAGLGFIPVQDEEYDFVIPLTRCERPAVQCFRELLTRAETQRALADLGFRVSSTNDELLRSALS